MEKTTRKTIFVFVVILVLAPLSLNAAAPRSAAKQQAAAEPACIDCHPDKGEGKVVHPAIAMGCGSCHTGNHGGEKPAPTLTTSVPDLCYTCHDKTAFDKKTLHTPVAGGMCVSCHNPHASANPRMLVAAVPELCFTCHDKKTMAKTTAHVSAAGGQCLICHNAHGSDTAFVLTQLVEGHCEACHDDITARHVMVRVSPTDSHPLEGKPDPLRKGKELSCPSCHNPHATEQLRISTKGRKGPEHLCLRCHKKTMVGP